LAEISASQPIQPPPSIIPSGSRVLAVKSHPLAISGSNSLGGLVSKTPANASGKSLPAAQFSGVLDYGQPMKNSAQETTCEVVAHGTGSIVNCSSSNRNINCSISNTSNSNININSNIINSNIINTTNISSNSYSSSLIFQTGTELHQAEPHLQQVGAYFYPGLKVTLKFSIFLIRK
jgi:hypothetical protein